MLKACKAFADEHKHMLAMDPWARARKKLKVRAVVLYWPSLTELLPGAPSSVMAPDGSAKARDLDDFKEWMSPNQTSA